MSETRTARQELAYIERKLFEGAGLDKASQLKGEERRAYKLSQVERLLTEKHGYASLAMYLSDQFWTADEGRKQLKNPNPLMTLTDQQTLTDKEMARLRLNAAMSRRQEDSRGAVIRLRERLEAVSPLNVLNRGYAMVYGEKNSLVTSAGQAEEEHRMRLRFADGDVDVVREERQGGQHGGKGNPDL